MVIDRHFTIRNCTKFDKSKEKAGLYECIVLEIETAISKVAGMALVLNKKFLRLLFLFSGDYLSYSLRNIFNKH